MFLISVQLKRETWRKYEKYALIGSSQFKGDVREIYVDCFVAFY